jgi:hypothetical protein
VIIEATLQPNATQAELEAVQHSIRKALDSGVNCENLLRGDLIRNHGQNADSPGFRQFEAEYNVRFPAGPLDISRELLAALRRADNYFRASVARLAISSRMLITGPSGIGKTHAIVDYALMRFERRQPSLVLFGEDFSVDEPWVTIAAKLGFGAINRPQLFAMMDAAAEAAGAFLIIFIDALNETKPDRHRWQIWLPALSAELERHAHLKLCISCRDTYLRGVIPEDEDIPTVTHNGFVGREFEACREFFDFYGLPAPTIPLLQPEFANPFFLHLVCQSATATDGRLPLERQSLTTILRMFLQAKNKAIAKALDYDEREDRVSKAVDRIVELLAANRAGRLRFCDARDAVETLYSSSTRSTSLFDQLERESIIAIVDNAWGNENELSVRFVFERMYDYRLAEHHLQGIQQPDVPAPFRENGNLYFAVRDKASGAEHGGLLEALSVILPERFGVELSEVIDPSIRREVSLQSIIDALKWRDPDSITARTVSVVREALVFKIWQHER